MFSGFFSQSLLFGKIVGASVGIVEATAFAVVVLGVVREAIVFADVAIIVGVGCVGVATADATGFLFTLALDLFRQLPTVVSNGHGTANQHNGGRKLADRVLFRAGVIAGFGKTEHVILLLIFYFLIVCPLMGGAKHRKKKLRCPSVAFVLKMW